MRRNLKNLKLRAIAAVDNPCQEHAKALVIKRDPGVAHELADLVDVVFEKGVESAFVELVDAAKAWPCVDALSQSIRSIVSDGSLTGGEQEARKGASISNFLATVCETSPHISKQLEPLLIAKKEGQTMNLEQALALIATQKAEIETLNSAKVELTSKLAVAEKAKADAMAEQAKADEECKTAKAALLKATDEVITYGGEEIKKSEVGDGPFKIAKAATFEAQTSRLEKRAAELYPHVVGTDTEKALVLKSIDGLPEDNLTRKAVEAILTSAEKMTAAGFQRLGGQGGQEPSEKAAQGTFETKVAEIAKRDSLSKTQAMSKARTEFPAEFAAAFPESAPSAN